MSLPTDYESNGTRYRYEPRPCYHFSRCVFRLAWHLHGSAAAMAANTAAVSVGHEREKSERAGARQFVRVELR